MELTTESKVRAEHFENLISSFRQTLRLNTPRRVKESWLVLIYLYKKRFSNIQLSNV